jgi:hypothetical protein
MTSQSCECAFCGEPCEREFCSMACREAWWLDVEDPPNGQARWS